MVSGMGTIRRRQKRICEYRKKNNLCSCCGCKMIDNEYKACLKCRKKNRIRLAKIKKKWRKTK